MGQGIEGAGFAGVGTTGESHLVTLVLRALFDLGGAKGEFGFLAEAEDGVLTCMGYPIWVLPRPAIQAPGAASCVVSVWMAEVYNAPVFVCALSRRRMMCMGCRTIARALERSAAPNPERSLRMAKWLLAVGMFLPF